jgi:predicted nucleic acid-binding protein
MPDLKDIVINTGPLLALIAAQGSLSILERLYRHVLVPYEVKMELTGQSIEQMQKKDIYLSASLIDIVLRIADET